SATMEPGLSTVIIVIVLTYWTWYARIIRSEILSLRERDYVAFAKVAGVSSLTIFFRHLLPNIFNTLIVLMTLQVGQVILFEASLSFLGLGIQAPDTSWGLMLADARQYITYAWWGITMPGIAIMLTCLSSNLVGDWLRDLLDPKRRQLGPHRPRCSRSRISRPTCSWLAAWCARSMASASRCTRARPSASSASPALARP